MSKVWSRLGAAVGSVALLVSGLVGVAAPVNAASLDLNEWTGLQECGRSNPQSFGSDEAAQQAANSAAPSTCPDGLTYVGYTTKSSFGMWYWNAKGCPVGEDCQVKQTPTAAECEADGKVLNNAGDACRDKTPAELCEEIDGAEWENSVCWEEVLPLEPGAELCPDGGIVNGDCVPGAQLPIDINCDWDAGEEFVDGEGCVTPKAPIVGEPVQKTPPPPPCWDASINNCPVGGALRFAAPEYAMVGVPVTMYAYASWRPDANSPAQPTNGTAVIRVDGEDYSGVEFKDGVAEWRFIPETEGVKEFTASGVVFSGLSGASAYIDTVEARTYVLEYDPAAYAEALKKKVVEVGEKFTITDRDQAKSYLNDRYEWRVADKSKDVCAVYETKKGAIKAKFNEAGKCKVIWMDTESAEKGKFSFIAKKDDSRRSGKGAVAD